MNAKPSSAPGRQEAAAEGAEVDYAQLSQFRYRLRRFLRLSEDLCRDHGVTSLQYQLLLHLKGFPGRDWATVGELAERLQAKHHGVVALLDRCEKLGFVKRQASTEDKRQVEVHLRPKGERLLAALAALHQPELRRLRSEFDPARWG